jgi:hypothetical protein
VIVDDLDIPGVPINPAETDPPLIVDADTTLALPTALERLERISGRRSQLSSDLTAFNISSFRLACRAIAVKRLTN